MITGITGGGIGITGGNSPQGFLQSLGGGDWLLVVFGLFLAAIIWQQSPTVGGMILAAIFVAMLAAWGSRGFTV